MPFMLDAEPDSIFLSPELPDPIVKRKTSKFL
jgi:hypothetical protein